MFVGDKYRQERIAGDFDVVIVGSGMGGLATAALLGQKGARVLVLERHFTAGGHTHSYTRHGFEWDVGLHYVGEVGHEKQRVRRLFDLVTGGALKWAPMDEAYDQVFIADRRYDLHAGRERFRDGLLEHFPRQKAALDKYLALIRKVQRAGSPIFAPKTMPAPLAALMMPARRRALKRYFRPTTTDVLESLTDDIELRAVLAGQWGDCGLPPGRSSFGMQAFVAGHYLQEGGFYPVGGASAIAAGAKQVIEKAGGAVLVRAEVERIVIERGRAVGVRLADGAEVRARTVVSAAGVATTVAKLLPEDRRGDLMAKRTLDASGASVSHACLYVGFDRDDATLELPSANLWLYPGPDHDANVVAFERDSGAPDPIVFMGFPSAKDPSWPERYPDRSTAEVLGLTPYSRFSEWRDQPWRNRGNTYNAFKEEFAERYFAALYRHLPQLEGRVKYYEMSSPLSTEHFANHPNGAIYGLAHSPARFLNDRVFPRTEIPGLYLTGQDVVTVGVASALLSGAMTAASVLGWRGLMPAQKWLM